MPGILDGRTALVTGGGGGIGRATALAMAREGARVAVSDASDATAQETVDLVKAASDQAIFVQADVRRSDEVGAMVSKVVAAYGRLDCAFNNAGVAAAYVGAAGQKTAQWSETAFNQVIAVNLTGVWLCMKAELIQMEKQGGGVIVNTASVAGLTGLPTASAYAASKHGVVGLTKTAALEYAQDNIRVNAICPGYIETNMTREPMRRHGEQIMARVPFKRMGRPEEIAELVVWLCSDRASFVTGVTYNVDGGYMA
jgi:NAD(P)-dependent dehydrogenase (short-subunit alcohol dehydrogenase family)